MMIDAHNEYSDAQAITASAASTNVLDLTTVKMGQGKPLNVNCKVNTAFESAAQDGTLTVTVQSDDDEAFGSATTHWQSQAIAEASLIAGYDFDAPPIPRNTVGRYVRHYFTVAGSGNFTAGKIDTQIVEEVQSNNYDAMAAFLS